MPHDKSVLDAIGPLREAGFALHWLHPRTKRPIGERWSEAPAASLETLRRTHAAGNNLGVRPGEPSSLVSGGFLHGFDVDIRIAELAGEAWNRFGTLFPDIDPESLPIVASGSGGESRHVYFVTDKAFASKVLAHSEGKHRGADGKWHYDWEIELFGTRKQVVLPPSIHPDTGLPYRWIQPFNLDLLALGLGPTIPAAAIESLAVAESETYEFETREPLTFEPGQMERDLDLIPVSDLHYDDWVRLGQALHHQFGGSQKGFDLWLHHTKRSAKFTGERQISEMRRSKWRSFGKYRGRPVTMATIRQWAGEERTARMVAEFDDLPEPGDIADAPTPAAPTPAALTPDAPTPAALTPAAPTPAAPTPAAPTPAAPTPAAPTPAATTETTDTLEAMLGVTADPLAAFDIAVAEPTADDWRWLLSINGDTGAIKPNLHNVILIVRNDSRLAGLAQINEFTQETVQRVPPGRKAPRRRSEAKPTLQLEGRVWDVVDRLNGDLWSDDRDFAVRAIFEAPKTQGGYDLKVSDRDLKAAIVLAANDHAFHPVREYLNRTPWDGMPRVESLFVDYLGAVDSAYTRAVARLMLVGAVTRIFEPGHKFDFAVILEGIQGKRKSTFIEILGRKWYAELEGDFHDTKEMVEKMQGAWIMELPELSSLQRADVRTVKAFISRKTDRARLAYARRAGSFPRQIIFIGSTNDREYLKDDTGGRRFWPMPCLIPSAEIDTDKLEREVDQLWAEAVLIYRAMREIQPHGTLPLYLRNEALHEAEHLQESRRVETEADAMAGQIAAWLDKPVRDGGFDDKDDGGEPRIRNETCLIEIWCECLHGDRKAYGRPQSMTLASAMRLITGWEPAGQKLISAYGKQRIFVRGGRSARLGFDVATEDALRAAA